MPGSKPISVNTRCACFIAFLATRHCPAAHRGVDLKRRFLKKHEARALVPCGKKAMNTLLQRTKARASVSGAVTSRDTCPVGRKRMTTVSQPFAAKDGSKARAANSSGTAGYSRSPRAFGPRSAVHVANVRHPDRSCRTCLAACSARRCDDAPSPDPRKTPSPPRSCNRLVTKEWIVRS